MTRPSRSSKKTTDSQVEKKGGYPSGGKPINLLPKVPKGPGPARVPLPSSRVVRQTSR